MAGEIAAAYIAVLPTMRGFGSQMVAQGGPQIRAAAARLGAQSGAALGAQLGGSASKAALPAIASINAAISSADRSSQNWLTSSASMAVKNVALYGSMYAAIQGVETGVSAAFGAMIGFNSQLEQADIGFTTMLKSSAAAKDQMQWIKDFAKESPFQYQDLVGYSQQLIALGFSADESRRVLVAAGDAAAGLGRGADGIARVNLALGQMWTKGKVQSQEMLQLTEAGISAWQILADAYGTSVGEVQEAVTRGLIDAQTAVPALLSGIEAQFGGLMEKQSTTFQGTWSNILDTLQQDLAEAGEPLFNELTADAREFLDALDDPQIQGTLNGIGQGLADVAGGVADLSKAAVAGLGPALPLMQGIASNAKTSLPVLLAVGGAYLAIRRASQGGLGVGFFLGDEGVVAKAQQAAAAVTSVEKPTRAMVAAQQAALSSSIKLGVAQNDEAKASAAASAAAKTATDVTTRSAEASKASWAAQRTLAEASRLRMAANAELVVSEGAVTAATERQLIAQKRLAAASAVFNRLSGVAQTVGMIGLAASVTAVGDAAAPTEQKVLGVVGALASGAVVGATFGSVVPGIGTAVGAAAGAVVGLTVALVNMQAAQDAANKDTSATADVLTRLGVSADTAKQLLEGLNNEGLEKLGGSQAVVDAIQQRGDAYDAVIAKVVELQGAEQAAAVAAASTSGYDPYGIEAAKAGYTDAADSAAKYSEVQRDLDAATSEAAYSQFLAIEAANAATGAFGDQAAAAYQAAVATGAIPPTMMQTGIAAEGAAGRVGYLLSALTGLPVNTPINFSTNATDILAKIYALQAAARGGFSKLGMTADGYQRQLQSYQDSLTSALQNFSVTPTLDLPSWGGSSGGGSSAVDEAAAAAKRAAEEAARKLKADQQAQLQFSDAFGSIMQAALAGNFEQYRDRLEDEITSLTRSGYKKAADTLKQMSGALTQAALDYAALTNKIKAADDAQSSLTKRMRDQYEASRDMITGLGKATDAQSFDQLAYLLGQTASAATQYQDVLKALKAQGLDDELWNQLAQAGPQSMGLAQSILAQGQAGIDQLNGLSGNLVDAADSMGTLVSESMYKQGVDAMKAYIDGLKSQSTALESQLETIANNVLTQAGGAITPGTSGITPISAAPQTVTNQYDINISAESLGDIKSVQDFIKLLEQQKTTELVNQAGTVAS